MIIAAAGPYSAYRTPRDNLLRQPQAIHLVGPQAISTAAYQLRKPIITWEDTHD